MEIPKVLTDTWKVKKDLSGNVITPAQITLQDEEAYLNELDKTHPLLPCPFCGNIPYQDACSQISCLNEDCFLSESWQHKYHDYDNAKHFREIWNKRS